jgi:DNA repair exonuclease SbcCD nuclease subunit
MRRTSTSTRLCSLALRDPKLADFIGNASRQVFARIIDLCLEERVQALLLAGDLYDGDQTSMKTARFLGEQLRRLDAAGVQTFIIRGNHDALARITKELVFPPNVHLFGGRAEAVEIERDRGERPIVIHGLSFAKPQAPKGLLAKYRAPVQDATNIGLMHTSLGGSPLTMCTRRAPRATSSAPASAIGRWGTSTSDRRSKDPAPS